jgi:hypothetical protein
MELPTMCDRATPAYNVLVVCFRSDAWSDVSIQCAANASTVCLRSLAGWPSTTRVRIAAASLRASLAVLP